MPPTGGEHPNGKPGGGGCTSCHTVGYTGATAVASFHQIGVTDPGAHAGYGCSLEGRPTGVARVRAR